MIRANELRLGNVIYLQNKPIKVNIDTLNRILNPEYSGNIKFKDQYKPIELTEEILLKCGFECYAESGVSKGFSIGVNPVTNDYILTLTWLKEIFNNNLDNYPFYRNGYHVIKYLHQLQKYA